VDTADAMLLFESASGVPVTFVQTAKPDVTGDGKVNNRDAMLLFRSLTQ
jgi:hypothetical protein